MIEIQFVIRIGKKMIEDIIAKIFNVNDEEIEEDLEWQQK